MKCIRILPEAWARTLCPLANSTRNMALGKFSLTTPSTSIASFLAISCGLITSLRKRDAPRQNSYYKTSVFFTAK